MTIKSTAVTVTTTATRLDTEVETDRNRSSSVAVFNNGSQTVYVGGADVTTSNGIPVPAGTWGPSIDVSTSEALYGRVAATTADVRVLEAGV